MMLSNRIQINKVRGTRRKHSCTDLATSSGFRANARFSKSTSLRSFIAMSTFDNQHEA